MKKLLLVLMVVALSSFLLVGCLGEGTVVDPDPDPDPTPAAEISVTVAGQAIVGDKTYVKEASLAVTVKFIDPIPADEAVWITNDVPLVVWVATTATDATRTEFKGTLTFATGVDECVPVCIQVLVGDICCADVIASQVVVVDGDNPYATVVLDVDTCSCTDEASFTFSGTKKTTCGYEGCCDDACSGFDAWTIKIWPEGADKLCDDPCFEDTGACPVTSATGCLDCLLFSDTTDGEVTYDVDYTLVDKVGNKVEDTFVVILDTDSVVSIDTVAEASLTKDENLNYILLDPEECEEECE